MKELGKLTRISICVFIFIFSQKIYSQCGNTLLIKNVISSSKDILRAEITLENISTVDTIYFQVPYLDSMKHISENLYLSKEFKEYNVFEFYKSSGLSSHGGIVYPRLYYIEIPPKANTNFTLNFFNTGKKNKKYLILKYSYTREAFTSPENNYFKCFDKIITIIKNP